MNKEMERCFPKKTATLSKYYLFQCDSLFSQVTTFGFKTRNKSAELQRTVETCSFNFKHICQSFYAEAPFFPLFLSLSPPTLSKIQGQWLCSAQLLEQRFKQSLGVGFYIVIEPPFNSFQGKHKGCNHVSCSFESPRLIIYTMAFQCISKTFLLPSC